jgi:hypothetical protein
MSAAAFGATFSNPVTFTPERFDLYEVTLDVDGARQIHEVRIAHSYGSLRQAGAEVKALKEQQAKGAKVVRCTHSRFLRTEVR